MEGLWTRQVSDERIRSLGRQVLIDREPIDGMWCRLYFDDQGVR